MFLFLFNAVLIDYARIIVAERQTEEAAKTALRSTMSAYNKKLQDKGLFAFNGNQAKANQIFQEVFEKNLDTGEGETFNFLGLKPVEGEVTTDLNFERSLANKEILEYQILEEMKYKAPVEIAEAIIEGFLAISGEMEEASTYAKAAKKLDEKAEERDELLEEAKEKLEEAQSELESIRDKIMTDLDNSTDNYPDVDNIYHIYQFHDRYLENYQNVGGNPGGYPATGVDPDKRKAETFKRNAVRLLNELVNAVVQAEKDTGDALELIGEASDVEDEMEDIYEEEKENTSQHYENAKDQNRSDETFEDEGGLGNAQDSIEDYFFGEEFYEELAVSIELTLEKIDKKNGRTDSLLPKLKEFRQIVNNDFANNKTRTKVLNLVTNTQRFYEEVTPTITASLDILEQAQADYKDVDAKDEEEAKEDEADEELEKSKETLDDIEADFKNVTGDADVYGILSGLVIDYGGAIEEFGNEFSMEDREDASEESMSFIDLLFSSIGEKLISGRDELYKNEYILMRFNSHDFDESGTNGLMFDNNQVEYIIYGKETFGANYFAALTEIFAVRFAINFVASLLDMKKKLLGPLMWITTIADALLQTADDMNKLTSGESIPLFPKKRSPVTSYQDYLRLFLFVHPEGKKTERIMAVLDYDTDTDLTESPTYVTGNATSTINLWFLPQVIRMIGSTSVINGRVEGNVYYIEKEVNYSY